MNIIFSDAVLHRRITTPLYWDSSTLLRFLAWGSSLSQNPIAFVDLGVELALRSPEMKQYVYICHLQNVLVCGTPPYLLGCLHSLFHLRTDVFLDVK